MAMKRWINILLLLLLSVSLFAGDKDKLLRSLEGYTGYSWERVEQDTMSYSATIGGVASSGKYASFWIHSNRYGLVSSQPYSGLAYGGVYKQMKQTKRWMDYSFGAEVAMQADNRFHIYPSQAYFSARLYVFNITVGFCPTLYDYDTANPLLTSGNFLFSQNARPLPRVTVSTAGYIPFPFLFGYVEIKGGLTHGWFMDNNEVKGSYLHHKYIGGRIGGKLPVNIAYEFHHAAQWGGRSEVFGDLGSSLRDYYHIFSAKNGGTNSNEQLNAEGNHLGSQQLTLTAKWTGWKVDLYWQNFFEDAPIYPLWSSVNRSDGLWGISIIQDKWRFISSVLYEFTNTTDQSGAIHDMDGLVIGGYDSYFTNWIYRNGWNYYNRTLGTPFITSPLYNEDGYPQTRNNRVRVHHAGIAGDIYGFCYRALYSHTENFGCYHDGMSNRERRSTNNALLLEVSKHVEKAWGLDFSVALSADIGTQFGNQFGAMIRVTKKGIVCNW